MKASTPLNSLNSQNKDKQIQRFLKAVPHLFFSCKGLQNIAKRFDISLSDLKDAITAYEARRVNEK